MSDASAGGSSSAGSAVGFDALLLNAAAEHGVAGTPQTSVLGASDVGGNGTPADPALQLPPPPVDAGAKRRAADDDDAAWPPAKRPRLPVLANLPPAAVWKKRSCAAVGLSESGPGVPAPGLGASASPDPTGTNAAPVSPLPNLEELLTMSGFADATHRGQKGTRKGKKLKNKGTAPSSVPSSGSSSSSTSDCSSSSGSSSSSSSSSASTKPPSHTSAAALQPQHDNHGPPFILPQPQPASLVVPTPSPPPGHAVSDALPPHPRQAEAAGEEASGATARPVVGNTAATTTTLSPSPTPPAAVAAPAAGIPRPGQPLMMPSPPQVGEGVGVVPPVPVPVAPAATARSHEHPTFDALAGAVAAVSPPDAPPAGMGYHAWMRTRDVPWGYVNEIDVTRDPRLMTFFRPPRPQPHLYIHLRWTHTRLAGGSALAVIVGKIAAHTAALRWFLRRRALSRAACAAALCAAAMAALVPAPVSLSQASQAGDVRASQSTVPPAVPHAADAAGSGPRIEFWLGVKHVPTDISKEALSRLFSGGRSSPRRVLNVRFYYHAPNSRAPYAAIEFASAGDVYECLDQAWVVRGVTVLDLQDCCGSLLEQFAKGVKGEAVREGGGQR